MKAIVNPSTLGKILKKSSPAIKKNTAILSCVLLEFEKNKVTVKATDLETSIISTMECDCKAPFYIIIEYTNLVDICSKITSPLLIDASGDKTVMKSDEGSFKFAKSVDQDNFPKIDAEDFIFDFDADSDFFWSLASANSCKNGEDLRVNMNAPCVHIKKNTVSLVGTDAMVLYVNKLKIQTGKEAQMMVPDQFVQMVKNFSEGKVSVSERFIKVESGNTSIISKLFDAIFCNYEAIIPPEVNYNLKVKRSEMVKALEVAGITANAVSHETRFNFSDSGIKILSQNIDYDMEGEADVKAEHSVDFESIGVNGNVMLKLLNIFDSEDVEMSFTTPTKAIFLRPSGEPNLFTLLMPLMLN